MQTSTPVALVAEESLTTPELKVGDGLEELVYRDSAVRRADIQGLESVTDHREARLTESAAAWVAHFKTLLKILRCEACVRDLIELTRAELVAWRAGNLNELAAIATRRRQLFPDDELRRLVIDQRNPAMADRVAAVSQAYPPGSRLLMLVGAAHLASDGSILDRVVKSAPEVQRCELPTAVHQSSKH